MYNQRPWWRLSFFYDYFYYFLLPAKINEIIIKQIDFDKLIEQTYISRTSIFFLFFIFHTLFIEEFLLYFIWILKRYIFSFKNLRPPSCLFYLNFGFKEAGFECVYIKWLLVCISCCFYIQLHSCFNSFGFGKCLVYFKICMTRNSIYIRKL